jgi:hypothetical protein
MKMTKEHYAYMKGAMSAIPRNKVVSHYEWLKLQPNVGDIAMRLRWDWFHAAGLTPWSCKELYPYLNDTHIDTALRKIVSELKAWIT